MNILAERQNSLIPLHAHWFWVFGIIKRKRGA